MKLPPRSEGLEVATTSTTTARYGPECYMREVTQSTARRSLPRGPGQGSRRTSTPSLGVRCAGYAMPPRQDAAEGQAPVHQGWIGGGRL